MELTYVEKQELILKSKIKGVEELQEALSSFKHRLPDSLQRRMQAIIDETKDAWQYEISRIYRNQELF